MESVAFRTQARTIDHLGREQIADCPTAISELWKNAYDAYARNVALHIFDGEPPVAAIFDDGHGMSYDEFVSRWLTVGTESKFDNSDANPADRLGLSERPKQGQKGIGRLSSANLGPLLLVVSKRRGENFVAALIDWRIFENPYLVLSDVTIPVVSFNEKPELQMHLPELFDRLTENIWGRPDQPERTQRVAQSWAAYDALKLAENPDSEKPSEAIAQTIIDSSFTDEQLGQWPVWIGESDHGTALLISQINLDLQAQISGRVTDVLSQSYREQFNQTLDQFTDPYLGEVPTGVNEFDPNFSYKVVAWHDGNPTTRISQDEGFGRSTTDQMEHIIEGQIDQDGIFRGQVKAFGEWRRTGLEYQILPPKDLAIPKRRNTKVGPIDIYIATFEQIEAASTHSAEDWQRLNEYRNVVSGLTVFRNGLRVLPYGRVDNDFFEIEQRRSFNAGREFWNARRMYGRLALSRENNPNLIDKAGREGFIDNKAARTLKALVMNVLMTAARDYFGSASEIRKPIIDHQKELHRQEKLESERKKAAQKNRRLFRKRLKENLPAAISLLEEVDRHVAGLDTSTVEAVLGEREELGRLQTDLTALRIPGPPKNLGSLEEDYREFRTVLEKAKQLLISAFRALTERIAELKPAQPREILEQELKRAAGQIHARTSRWQKEIKRLQKTEESRISEIFDDRNRLLHQRVMPMIVEVERRPDLLAQKLEEMDATKREIEGDNEEIFPAYIATLELMNENIDLELLSNEGVAEYFDQQQQISRLNALAQLGIAVEILDHEMAGYMRSLRSGLRMLRDVDTHAAVALRMETAFNGLNRQLEFISPLRISGDQTPEEITGADIVDFLQDFFATVLKNRKVVLTATADFHAMSVYDLRSRLYPVFINLVNNSIYWLQSAEVQDPQVLLDFRDDRVIVADNGPGVVESDIKSLFQLFFTRKLSGGRGIGLYLARANLRAAGHSIEYVQDDENKRLSGANFAIIFKGTAR